MFILVGLAGACGSSRELVGTIEARTVAADKMNPLYLRIDVRESELGHISIGKKVPIRVAAFPDETFVGTIERFHARGDLTYTLSVALVAGKDELQPGMTATITVVD